MDTALLLAGRAVLPELLRPRRRRARPAIRALADSIYRRVDWQLGRRCGRPAIALGWSPEERPPALRLARLQRDDDPATLLALGSPTHPVEPGAWRAYVERLPLGRRSTGQEHLGFAPLFGHQYSHVWIDFRGIQDSVMRAHGIDYFENSRRATLAQQRVRDRESVRLRGLRRATVGPHRVRRPAGRHASRSAAASASSTPTTRAARPSTEVGDDGTIAPTAAGGSIPFAPEIAIPTLLAMRAALRRRRCSDATASWTRSTRRSTSTMPHAARARRAGRRLVRHRLPRHRPGPDPRDDRELPQRPRVADHAHATRTSCAGSRAPASPAAGSTTRPAR